MRTRSPLTHKMMNTLAVSVLGLFMAASAHAAPPIRTSAANPVPQCVTPERLMAFLETRNDKVEAHYRDIARWYKYWGEKFNVRWDYAFYQMAIETNYLKYRRGNGRRGDVHEKQYNFAGIGATGGGVAGDRFPDVKTGVQAQFQHLVAYSGEFVDNPVAKRTRENQDHIIEKSKRLKRTVTFGDLARRWAVDRYYAKSIDSVADQFRSGHCTRAVADAGKSAFVEPAGLGGAGLGSPEPLRLAGPADDLPWTGAQEPAQADTAKDKAKTSQPAETGKKKTPARTIWSRDGKVDPAAAPTPVTGQPKQKPDIEPVAKIKDAPAPQPTADVKPAVDAPTLKAPALGSAVATGAASKAAETPESGVVLEGNALPTFRIAPRGDAEPSKLGGPALRVLNANAETANTDVQAVAVTVTQPLQAPRASFKEIIGTPPPSITPSSNMTPCRVVTASYGGKKTLLVRTAAASETRYTALTVLEGFEKTMFDTYAKANGSGEIVGEYATKDEALADARANCPSG